MSPEPNLPPYVPLADLVTLIERYAPGDRMELGNVLCGLRVIPIHQSYDECPIPWMIQGFDGETSMVRTGTWHETAAVAPITHSTPIDRWNIEIRSMDARHRLLYVLGRSLYESFDIDLGSFTWWKPRELALRHENAHVLFLELNDVPYGLGLLVLVALVAGLLDKTDLSEIKLQDVELVAIPLPRAAES